MIFRWLKVAEARIRNLFSIRSKRQRSLRGRPPLLSRVSVEILEKRQVLTPVLANVEVAPVFQPVNSAPVNITTALTVAGNPASQILSATLSLDSNLSTFEDVLTYPSKIGNISGTFDPTTGKLSLTGADSAGNYQLAIRSVTYQDTNSNPSTLIRRFQITASDATGQSLPVYRYLKIVPMITNVPVRNLTYTEGDLATPVASQISLSPTASNTITSASIRIDANYSDREDILAFVGSTASSNSPNSVVSPRISGAWNSSTGTLTLTAVPGQTPILADFQAALRSVTYENTSQNPSPLVRRFAIWINDGDSPALNVYSYFNVIAVNNPPEITKPDSLMTVEETPVLINGVVFSDADANSGYETVTLSVSHGILLLGSFPPAGLPAGSNTGNNSASLTLSAPIAKLNALVSKLTYLPFPNYSGQDTLAILINDNGNSGTGGPLTAQANVAIPILRRNRPPTVASPKLVSASENTNVIVSGITFADPDAGSSVETVSLSVSQGILTVRSTVLGGLTSSQIIGNGTSTITINGTLSEINATLSDQTGLIYVPNLNFFGSDVISILIDDQGHSGAGGPATAQAKVPITIAHVNQRPVVSNLETVAFSYFEKDSSTPISSQIVVSDVDHASLASGTVSIDANYTPGEDVLGFIPNAATGNIAAVSNMGGILVLASSGATATTANWQAAFRSVTYKDTSLYPNTAVRRFLFQVNDGSLSSLQQYRWFTVTAVNDSPTITAPSSAKSSVNSALIIGGISFADPDAGSSRVTLTLFCLSGVLTINTDITGGLTASEIFGNTTSRISITTTLSALNTTFSSSRGLVYQPKTDFIGTDVLSLNLNDNGNTGLGGPLGASASVRLSITK